MFTEYSAPWLGERKPDIRRFLRIGKRSFASGFEPESPWVQRAAFFACQTLKRDAASTAL